MTDQNTNNQGGTPDKDVNGSPSPVSRDQMAPPLDISARKKKRRPRRRKKRPSEGTIPPLQPQKVFEKKEKSQMDSARSPEGDARQPLEEKPVMKRPPVKEEQISVSEENVPQPFMEVQSEESVLDNGSEPQPFWPQSVPSDTVKEDSSENFPKPFEEEQPVQENSVVPEKNQPWTEEQPQMEVPAPEPKMHPWEEEPPWEKSSAPADTVDEPKSESGPLEEVESPEPEVHAEPEPEAEDQSEPQVESSLEPEPEPESESESEPDVQTEAEDISIGPPEESPPPLRVGRLRDEEPVVTPHEAEVITERSSVRRIEDIPREKLPEDIRHEDETASPHEMNESQHLEEKKSPMDAVMSALEQVWPIIQNVFHLRIIGGVLLVLLLGGGIYYGATSGILTRININFPSWFGGSDTMVLPEGPPLTDEELRQYGFSTSFLFSGNRGAIYDRIPTEMYVAAMYAELKEPKIPGETGITASAYYAELKDLALEVNEFVTYVQNLDDLRNLYKIDVYALLDQTTHRAEKLIQYIQQLKAAQAKSQEYLSFIHLNIDDMNQSMQSIAPDKQKFEADFFAAMESLQAEKSDVLLKSFVDVSQKQVALKARIGALQKLVDYYDTALQKVATRIEAVEKNTDALLQGIRVVDVPGGGVDVIIKQ